MEVEVDTAGFGMELEVYCIDVGFADDDCVIALGSSNHCFFHEAGCIRGILRTAQVNYSSLCRPTLNKRGRPSS